MNTAPHPLIAAALAMPKTHVVITRYADGRERRHETRSLKTAENHAIGERRKIGRDLISRGDSLHEVGEKVRVVAVEIAEI